MVSVSRGTGSRRACPAPPVAEKAISVASSAASSGARPQKRALESLDTDYVVSKNAGNVCRFCKCTSLEKNPCPKRHKSECIAWANKTCCLPCRNYLNVKKGSIDPAQLLQEMATDADKQSEYIACRLEHSMAWDNCDGQYKDDGRIRAPSWCLVKTYEALEGEEVMPNFWPSWLIQKMEGWTPSKEEQEVYTKPGGKKIVGQYRCPSKGTPVGCIIVKKKDGIEVSHTREAASSRDGSSSDVKKAAAAISRSLLDVKASSTEASTPDGETRLSLAASSRIVVARASDESSDWITTIKKEAGVAALPKKKGLGKKINTSSSSSESASADKKKSKKRLGSAFKRLGNRQKRQTLCRKKATAMRRCILLSSCACTVRWLRYWQNVIISFHWQRRNTVSRA